MNRRSSHRRLTGWAAAVLAALTLAVVAGCGFNVQTLQPYTPADGVNFTLGDGVGPTLKVRGAFILADDQGAGFLSASMVMDGGTDTLRSITGVALTADGASNGDLTIGSFDPIEIGQGSLVVLVDRAPITVTGEGLTPGVNARLTFVFANAGSTTQVIPVLSSSDPVYAGVTPRAPSASPSSSG